MRPGGPGTNDSVSIGETWDLHVWLLRGADERKSWFRLEGANTHDVSDAFRGDDGPVGGPARRYHRVRWWQAQGDPGDPGGRRWCSGRQGPARRAAVGRDAAQELGRDAGELHQRAA